jgi:hypothetical protein
MHKQKRGVSVQGLVSALCLAGGLLISSCGRGRFIKALPAMRKKVKSMTLSLRESDYYLASPRLKKLEISGEAVALNCEVKKEIM